MRIDGACHCGAISIEGEADPDKTVICHCTDCQTSAGSAFRFASCAMAPSAFDSASCVNELSSSPPRLRYPTASSARARAKRG